MDGPFPAGDVVALGFLGAAGVYGAKQLSESGALEQAGAFAADRWSSFTRKVRRAAAIGVSVAAGILSDGKSTKVEAKVQEQKIETQKRKEQQDAETARREKEKKRGDGSPPPDANP